MLTMRQVKKVYHSEQINVLKSLSHPNIVKYYDSFLCKGKLCIIMDYAENGDLSKKIKEAKISQTPFDLKQVFDWFCELCLALKHIHQKKILHRDLKCQNIFLTKDNQVKLGDFGISKVLESTHDFAKTSLGTPYYLSPEVCMG